MYALQGAACLFKTFRGLGAVEVRDAYATPRCSVAEQIRRHSHAERGNDEMRVPEIIFYRTLISLALLIGLAGCASIHPQGESQPKPAERTEARPQPLFPLAPPSGPPRRIVQQLTAHWPGSRETLLCVLELDNRRIAMAGLTQDGLSLFNLTYDGKKLEADKSPLVPETLVPEMIIADLQLVYWPLDSLQKQLPKGLQLEAGPGFRRLSEQGQPLVEVRYLSQEDLNQKSAWPKEIELTHKQYHYKLTIHTLSYEVVSE
jgi:hypothetical protein